MAARPPHPTGGSAGDGSEPGRPAGGRAAWRRLSAAAWRWLRTRPGWVQLLLWLTAWPVAAALYVARSRRLGPLAAPLTVAVLLVTGPLWWAIMAGDGARGTASFPVQTAQPSGAVPATGFGTVAFAGEPPGHAELPEFDPDTLELEIVECVQTRSTSTVRDGTIRQPRVVVRVSNHGPERTVVLQGAVLLDGYAFNGGWKPTARTDLALAPGQSADATLLTDYRHQAAYSPDGLHACRLIGLQVLAPQVWPDHAALQALPAPSGAVPGSERDFDPARDLLRRDTR